MLTTRVSGTLGRRVRAAAAVVALAVAGAAVGAVAPADGAKRSWRPAPGTTWQWQLSGRLDLSVRARMFDVDLFDTPAGAVARLHARGRGGLPFLFSRGAVGGGRRPPPPACH